MFTLGDVADILDNALDMGINIVEALHKLAEAGDRGQVSKSECISQLELSGGARGGCIDDEPTSSITRKAIKSHGDHETIGEVGQNAAWLAEGSQEPNNEDLLPGYKRESIDKGNHDTSYNWDELTRYVTVQDLDRESWSKKLHDVKEDEISPLRICSSNVRLEQNDNEYSDAEKCYTDGLEHYGTPLKKFKSKRWSNTLALNMENDNYCPQKTRHFSDSASRQSSFSGYVSSDEGEDYSPGQDGEENHASGEETPGVKRQRRNTYSIESTPIDEAEDRGLPIIDVLDDLCAMADQFMGGEWAGYKESSEFQSYHEGGYDYSSSEDEIPPIASKSTDEKILDLDKKTTNAYRSLTDAMQMEGGMSDSWRSDENTLRNANSGSNLDDIVDQKIADIGNQAEIVLESFKSLKQLRQYEKQQCESEFSAPQNLSSIDYHKSNDFDNGTSDLPKGNYDLEDENHKNIADLDNVLSASRPEPCYSVQGIEEVETKELEVNGAFSVIYSCVEESLPWEFKTVAIRTYDCLQAGTVSENNAELSELKSSSSNATERKRPGTYVIDASKEKLICSVYEEPVFINGIDSNSQPNYDLDISNNISLQDSQQLSQRKGEEILVGENFNEINAGKVDSDVLESSDSHDVMHMRTIGSPRAARPGTYILTRSNLNHSDEFQTDQNEYEVKEGASPQLGFQHSTCTEIRPSTSDLQNHRSFILEGDSNVGPDADNISPQSGLQFSTGTKKRPGTFVLQNHKSFISEGDGNLGPDADDTSPQSGSQHSTVTKGRQGTFVLQNHKSVILEDDSNVGPDADDTSPHLGPQHSTVAKGRPGTFVLQNHKSAILEGDSNVGPDADDTSPHLGPQHSTVAKGRPGTFVLQNHKSVILEDDSNVGPDADDTSPHLGPQHSTVAKGRPGTFVLQNHKSVILEDDSNVGPDADDTSPHLGPQHSTVAKGRPGTFVLQNHKSVILEDDSNVGPDADDTSPHLGPQHSTVAKGRPGTFVLQNHKSAILEGDSNVGPDADDTSPQSGFQHSTVTKGRPGTYVLQNHESFILEGDSNVRPDADAILLERHETHENLSLASSTMKKRPDTYILDKSIYPITTESYISPPVNYSKVILNEVPRNHDSANDLYVSSQDVCSEVCASKASIDGKEIAIEVDGKEVEMEINEMGTVEFEAKRKSLEDIRTQPKAQTEVADILQDTNNCGRMASNGNEFYSGNQSESSYVSKSEDLKETEDDRDDSCQGKDVLLRSGASTRLDRPGTYVLTKLSVNSDSFDVIEQHSVVEGPEVESVDKEAVERKSDHEATWPMKARPGTFTFDTSMTFRPVATDEISIDVEAVGHDPIRNAPPDGIDIFDEASDRIVSEESESHRGEDMKRRSRARRSRPGMAKIDKALSRVLQASGNLYKLCTEVDLCSSAGKAAESNVLQGGDSSMPGVESPDRVSLSMEYPVPKLEPVSNTLAEKSAAESSLAISDKAPGVLHSDKQNFGVKSSIDFAGKISERAFNPDTRISGNAVEDVKGGVLYSDSKQNSGECYEGGAVLNVETQCPENVFENFTERFKPPKRRKPGGDSSKNLVTKSCPELNRQLNTENASDNSSIVQNSPDAVSLENSNNHATIFQVTNEKGDGILTEKGLCKFVSTQQPITNAQHSHRDSIENKPFQLDPKSRNQNSEGVAARNMVEDLGAKNEDLISSSEKPGMTIGSSEMNNNDLGTVEKDFSFKADYSEMADECTVLSTVVQNDCC